MKHLFYISILLFAIGCSTERIEPENKVTEFESADSYLDSQKPEEQEYTITEEGDGPLVGENGTKIWIGKDILQFPNGDSVAFPYTIKLIELYTPKDIILSRMPTVSGTQLLTCHGEIRIRAYKNEIELILRPNAFWKLEIPNSNPLNDMIVYYGSNSDANAVWTNEFNTPFNQISSGYSANIAKMGWVSCSKPAFKNDPVTQYTFYSDSVDIRNFNTFLYLPNLDGVMQSGQNSYPVPLDEEIKIVSIASKSDTLYRFYKETTTSEDTMMEIVPEKTNNQEFINLLGNL